MPNKSRTRKVFEHVEIIDTADEGLSIGKCADGLIIQVKGAVPGDVVDAMVVEKRKGMFITMPVNYIISSGDRTDPFCSHFGTCGGCKWQHMQYDAQVKYKEKKVQDAFRRIGELDGSVIESIVKAPLQTYYRNKMEFTASERRWLTDLEMKDQTSVEHKQGVGFHLAGAYDKVLDISHCYLQADPSNDIRHFIKNLCRDQGWSFQNMKTKSGFLRNILIRNTVAGEFMVIIVVGENAQDKIELVVKGLVATFSQVTSVFSCVNLKVNDSIHDLEVRHEYGEDSIVEQLGHVRYKIGPKSFFQTNSLQALTLYTLTRDLAGLEKHQNVFDLYCGVGSLGLFMAEQCKQVIGIEQIAEAVDDAKVNASINKINNAKYFTGQVELMLDPGFTATHGHPDVVITDPPRAGMHPNVISHLIAASPNRIVYVSCNPATQARDLKMLSSHYKLKKAIPVDMFPHTHHVECIALIERL